MTRTRRIRHLTRVGFGGHPGGAGGFCRAEFPPRAILTSCDAFYAPLAGKERALGESLRGAKKVKPDPKPSAYRIALGYGFLSSGRLSTFRRRHLPFYFNSCDHLAPEGAISRMNLLLLLLLFSHPGFFFWSFFLLRVHYSRLFSAFFNWCYLRCLSHAVYWEYGSGHVRWYYDEIFSFFFFVWFFIYKRVDGFYFRWAGFACAHGAFVFFLPVLLEYPSVQVVW